MSQQINLILPALRPRFDWLGLPVILAAGLLAILLAGGLYAQGKLQLGRLQAQEAGLRGEAAALQQQVQALAQAAAARKGDPALAALIEALQVSIGERRAVLQALESGAAGSTTGFAGTLDGFSRQTLSGVWLTRLSLQGGEIEIEGAVLDPALLPRFIEKLNAEPVFAGRNFAALDMQEVLPDAPPAAGSPTVSEPSRPKVPLRHIRFVLRSKLGDKPEGAR